ncbi:MAG: hypothetical protein ACYSU7_19355 [Planctomycetota bacterium]|jgi:hypothetical protein
MIRLLAVVLVLLFVGAGFSGCSEDQSSGAAELGIQEGRRPAKSEKRPPPGPQDSGFQQNEEDDGQAPPEPPDPDN